MAEIGPALSFSSGDAWELSLGYFSSAPIHLTIIYSLNSSNFFRFLLIYSKIHAPS